MLSLHLRTQTINWGVILLTFSKMDLKHVWKHESFSTVPTEVGALTIMRSSVDSHVPRGGKPLLADLTDISLLVVVHPFCFATRSGGKWAGPY